MDSNASGGNALRLQTLPYPPYPVDSIFAPLEDKPDHAALELEVLEAWEREDTFETLREQNRGGPKFSFIDGPITANNGMGVHHAWGRTLKDVFQRYKALRGFDQRYQNGFDCQGLWVEVEVEKALGLNSKREIEEYGLAEFAERCVERVAHYSGVIAEQSKRLGMWMDWERSYFTFTDTNIEYIWGFLKAVHERGWLYQGHRSTVWCPRCGTSISQHEVFSGEYKELEHPSLTVRLPLRDRDGRVARDLDDDAVDAAGERRRRREPRRGVHPARGRGLGRARARSRGDGREVRARLRARRPRVRGAVRPHSRAGGRRPPRHPVGRRLARGGDGDRPHRARRRLRGLRARADPRAPRAGAARRGGSDAARVRVRRALDGRRGRAR